MPKYPIPSTHVGRKRLLKLADLLDADAKKKDGIKFNLAYFVMPSQFKGPTLDCETEACAVGLACISGAFKRAGLGWELSSNGRELIPTFKDNNGADAAGRFFGIDYDEFDFLFMPQSYETKKGADAERIVAKRIRSFVAGKSAPAVG